MQQSTLLLLFKNCISICVWWNKHFQ